MTSRDEIPPCTCAEFREDDNFIIGTTQRDRYQEGYVGCRRHPNASTGKMDKPPPKSNSQKALDRFTSVHFPQEARRRLHIRNDEEYEPKAWHRR
jgi:hypothetical protein